MKITVNIRGLDRVEKALAKLAGGQLKQATAAALTDTAYTVRGQYQAEMRRAFDRPTPYILSSVRVHPATPTRLIAQIEPTYLGGKGVEPGKILAAEVAGGTRRDKRSEIALRRAGILPAGYQTAIPRVPYPGSDDGRGNLRGPFIVRLLSYFQTFGEQGYRANMTQRRKDKLADIRRSDRGFKVIAGVVFFVAHGRLRSGPSAHLAPGIWAKSGTHGSNVQPVLMFVRTPAYQVRLDLRRVIAQSQVQERFASRLRYRIRQAAGQ